MTKGQYRKALIQELIARQPEGLSPEKANDYLEWADEWALRPDMKLSIQASADLIEDRHPWNRRVSERQKKKLKENAAKLRTRHPGLKPLPDWIIDQTFRDLSRDLIQASEHPI